MAIDPNVQTMADKMKAARSSGMPMAPARPAQPQQGNPADAEIRQLLQAAMQAIGKAVELMGAEESGEPG